MKKIILLVAVAAFVFTSCEHETFSEVAPLSTFEKENLQDSLQPDQTETEPRSCETAFATGSDVESTCFIEDGFNRWGWTLGALPEGNYTFDLYAGAGQCDTDKGELVGLVSIDYTGGTASVTYRITNAGYSLTETHLYVGSEAYPTAKNGKTTVAPGKYGNQHNLDDATSDSYTVDGLSGDIYIIAHAVVCEGQEIDPNEPNDPIDPIEPIEPIEPAEPEEPAEEVFN